MSDNIRQSKDTQTEDNEEDKSQKVCFFNYKNIFIIISFIDSNRNH
jgi:hypothetical protein